MLDRHVVADERKILAEQGTSGRRGIEMAVLDQAHHRERCQPLRSTRDPELSVHLIGDLVATVCQPVGLRHFDPIRAVDPYHTGERRLRGDRIEFVPKPGHEETLLTAGRRLGPRGIAPHAIGDEAHIGQAADAVAELMPSGPGNDGVSHRAIKAVFGCSRLGVLGASGTANRLFFAFCQNRRAFVASYRKSDAESGATSMSSASPALIQGRPQWAVPVVGASLADSRPGERARTPPEEPTDGAPATPGRWVLGTAPRWHTE